MPITIFAKDSLC